MTSPEKTDAGGASVTVRGLWKVFGPHAEAHANELRAGKQASKPEHTVAVRDVSFDVFPGETFVVMGLSGSGKSTLVRCLTRLVEPTLGDLKIDGTDVRAMSPRDLSAARKDDWAMVFQHFGLLPHRRVLSNVAFGLEVNGISRGEREQKARELVDLVGLAGVEEKFPYELSGGMRQRVGLARALAVQPRLLLLDEPFSALDPLIRNDLQNELLRLAQIMRQTSVFITHDLSEALKMGSRIAIMKDGELVQVGTPEEIVLKPVNDYVRRFAIEAPRAEVLRASTVAEPAAVVESGATPEAIHRSLSESGLSSVILRSPGDNHLRVVSREHLTASSESEASIAPAASPFSPVVGPDMRLVHVMDKLRATEQPVVVCEGGGNPVGIIRHRTVITALTHAGITEEQ